MNTAGMPDPEPSGPYRRGAAAPQALTEVAAASVGGRIYLLGGLAASGGQQRVEVYDPAAQAWMAGPALPGDAPTHHLAVAAWRGQIYVLGGYTDLSFTPTAMTLRLDPASGAWTRLRDQPIARGAATAQTLGDRLYVVGGASPVQGTTALWAYDPASDTWVSRASMPTPREHLASCADGLRMLVVGGRAPSNLRSAEVYEADRDRWTSAAELPTARGGLAAASLDRRCYVVGGEALDRPPPNTFAENEAFDWDRGTWSTLPPLPTPRHGLAAVAVGPALYTLLGGPQAGFTFSTAVEIFTP
jgi:N-acetylneuraminic acid mutarotase